MRISTGVRSLATSQAFSSAENVGPASLQILCAPIASHYISLAAPTIALWVTHVVHLIMIFPTPQHDTDRAAAASQGGSLRILSESPPKIIDMKLDQSCEQPDDAVTGGMAQRQRV